MGLVLDVRDSKTVEHQRFDCQEGHPVLLSRVAGDRASGQKLRTPSEFRLQRLNLSFSGVCEALRINSKSK